MKPARALPRRLGGLLVIGLACAATAPAQTPLGTAFTYQGQLKNNGAPVETMTGQLRFTLYDAQTAGNPVGSPLVLTNVTIQDGLFSAALDFGAAAFGANARWLQVAVWSGSAWVDLSPRQRVSPAPAALFAQSAAGLTWPISAACAGGPGINSMFELDYAGDGSALVVNATGPDARAIYASTTEFDTSAVYADVWGDVSTAVVGYANAAGPEGYGVGGAFVSRGEHGTGLFAHAQAATGRTFGVYGRTNSPQGYGGYFEGRGYFSQEVGIGTDEPDYPLHVVQESGTAVAGECMGEGTAGYLGHEWAGVHGTGPYGVWGNSSTSGGFGVVGSCSATTGECVGVRGQIASTTGAAVSAQSTATSGTANGVYGTTATTLGSGVFGQSTSHTGEAEGVMGVSMSPAGKGVLGYNSATSGNACGVYGETESPTGFAGYFIGRGYFSESVGLGVSNPTQALDVAGTIQTTGFKLTTGPAAGYVLTSDAAGVASWQPAAAGGVWESAGAGIYYDGGDVGIGTDSPAAPLDVFGGNWDLGATEGDLRVGDASYRLKIGVATSGSGAGTARLRAQAATGTPKLILGAGSLDTVTVTSNSVGIGTTVPTTKLDVLGTVKMTGFTLNSSPSAGYVLTCDATGNGTWQAPTGGGGGEFALPYEGTLDSGSAGIKVTNDGSGAGLHGIGGNYGVRGEATTNGVYGFSSSGNGVNGYSNSGVGVKAQSNGVGVDHPGLRVINNNDSGIAIYSISDSTDANTVIANTGTGDLIRGFSGTTGGDLVFRVENDGRTHVSVLQINGGSDLSEQFDIQSSAGEVLAAEAQPGMVVCIDPANPGKLTPSTRAYDRTVAGVISGAGGVQPGMLMGQHDTLADGQHPVALTGRVYVWADASQGAIQPGDLLTTSNRAGHAMRVADHGQAHGAVLGKAMTALGEGQGLVLMLVSLQ